MTKHFNTERLAKDYSPTGIKIEGAYENDRNACFSDLFKDIIREVYGVTDVICGHHLVLQMEERRADGFTYQLVQEIPSADTLIFDHEVAEKLWGAAYQDVLMRLALEPIGTRDQLLADLYYGRTQSLPELMRRRIETPLGRASPASA